MITISGTRASRASATAGCRLAPAVPEVVSTTTGLAGLLGEAEREEARAALVDVAPDLDPRLAPERERERGASASPARRRRARRPARASSSASADARAVLRLVASTSSRTLAERDPAAGRARPRRSRRRGPGPSGAEQLVARRARTRCQAIVPSNSSGGREAVRDARVAAAQRLRHVRGGSDPDRPVERAREVDGQLARRSRAPRRRRRPSRASPSRRRTPAARRARASSASTTLSSADERHVDVAPAQLGHLLERRRPAARPAPVGAHLPQALGAPRRPTRRRWRRPGSAASAPTASRTAATCSTSPSHADLELEGLEAALGPRAARSAATASGSPATSVALHAHRPRRARLRAAARPARPSGLPTRSSSAMSIAASAGARDLRAHAVLDQRVAPVPADWLALGQHAQTPRQLADDPRQARSRRAATSGTASPSPIEPSSAHRRTSSSSRRSSRPRAVTYGSPERQRVRDDLEPLDPHLTRAAARPTAGSRTAASSRPAARQRAVQRRAVGARARRSARGARPSGAGSQGDQQPRLAPRRSRRPRHDQEGEHEHRREQPAGALAAEPHGERALAGAAVGLDVADVVDDQDRGGQQADRDRQRRTPAASAPRSARSRSRPRPRCRRTGTRTARRGPRSRTGAGRRCRGRRRGSRRRRSAAAPSRRARSGRRPPATAIAEREPGRDQHLARRHEAAGRHPHRPEPLLGVGAAARVRVVVREVGPDLDEDRCRSAPRTNASGRKTSSRAGQRRAHQHRRDRRRAACAAAPPSPRSAAEPSASDRLATQGVAGLRAAAGTWRSRAGASRT